MRKREGRYCCKKAVALCLLAVMGAVMLTGCKKKEKINPASTHTTAAAETMTKEKETEIETTAAATEAVKEDEAAKNITAKKRVYESGKVSIEYPTVVNVADAAQAEALDTLLKDNALAIIDGLGIDETKDILKVTCQVMHADRSQLTIVYKGTLDKGTPDGMINIFYTSTVDVKDVKNIRFSKYADPYTMAGYVLSDDCIFPAADETLTEKLKKEKNQRTLDQYTMLFTNADFSEEGIFPEVFSYEYEGNIYFSIPVSHEAGDYAIVMFSPDGK